MSDSRTLEALDRAHLIHPLRDYREQQEANPRIVRGGKGIRIEMSDGRTVIDGFSGLWNINVGHGRTEIADAVYAQMLKLPYYPAFQDFSTEPAIRLAERLATLFPADRGIERFLFTSGGSDANETAFHFARQYHAVKGHRGRTKILSRHWSYHGTTRSTISATRIPLYHYWETPDPLHIQIAAPYCLRCDLGKTYPTCNVACADDLTTVLEREDPNTVAAVIADPVMGTGGMIVPPEEYYPKLQQICRDHDVLLILDEVVTGFGRTGRWFGMEHWGIEPDLVTFAKGITSGYLPLGGVGVTKRVFETLRDGSPKGMGFMAGLTYNNHATACTAALANLEIVEREGLVENAAQVGAYLHGCLRETLGDLPYVAEIRGIGMLAAVEWAEPGTTKPLTSAPMMFPALVSRKAWERGLIVRPMLETTGVVPPLCTTREDVDEIVAILASSAKDVMADVEARRASKKAGTA